MANRLRGRREEIEQVLLARTRSISDARSSNDPEYQEGVRAAVSAGVEYGISAIEVRTEEAPPPLPAEILKQTRLAARNAIALDTVTLQYVAASHLLESFALEEIEPRSWKTLHRLRALALEVLLRDISAEYKRAQSHRHRSRQAETLGCVEALLRGEPVDRRKLDYDLDQNHLAIIARGQDSEGRLRRLARSLDSRLLLVHPDPETAWAWLGRRSEVDYSKISATLSANWDPTVPLAVGEPANGLAGWQRTHRHARHAMIVARRGISPVAYFRRDGLLASLIHDELLSSVLWSLYIGPLLDEGGRSSLYLRTLRAYLNANRNGASAAAALGVSRQTVANHLRAIEGRIETSIPEAGAELELALRLHAAGFAPARVDRPS